MALGITNRLVLSFAAVAVLAAAANLIAEDGVEVIRTHHLDLGLTSATPTVDRNWASLSDPAAATAATVLRGHNGALFAAAIGRYQRAVEVRATVDSPAATAEERAAAQNLESASEGVQQAADLPDPQKGQRRQALQTYEAAGRNSIRLADAGRAALQEIAGRAEAMDEQLKTSLDGAWKIFGRVLARQSLMQLRSELEDIRRSIARRRPADGDRSAMTAVTAGETAFAATFNRNAAALSRAEGGRWVLELRDNSRRLAALVESITKLDSEAQDAAGKFENARARLWNALPRPTSLAAEPQPQSQSQAQPQPHSQALPARSAAAPTQLPIASPVIDTIITTSTALKDRERRLVGWITAAVLAVILTISVWTVRSIVIPVRRMTRATKKIADGEVDVRVPDGGLKELDTLSQAFNGMAAELAEARNMARDYQQRLEEKVELRTRQLQHLAEHDSLTHLPNRRQIFVLLNHALERAAKNRRHVAVFFMDIDNFKNLNDSMGHAFGDQVLACVGRRLKETAQAFGFAGRLGGDEFTAVYEDAASAADLLEAGRRLVETFDRPLSIEGREVVVRVSVGASLYPDHGHRAEDLLSAADAALFRAKAMGRNQLALFTPELLETAARKFTIEQCLRRAIEKDEFDLVYQPEVSLDSLDMVLVESLVRWRLPDGRQALPAEFLSVTEESGLIIDLGNWILRKAIKAASDWHHGEWPDARIAINVSPRQLMDRRFADLVLELLGEYRLPARCIELELTESVLQTGPATIESLRHLRSHDIAIALDDFGTGYSSLASLENLPLSRIKLDRSLIAGIDRNPRSAAIAASLIGLCKGLGLEVTAEGVERPEQFAALAHHRSIHLQGYLISKPVAADDVLSAKRLIPRIMQDLLLGLPGTGSGIRRMDFESSSYLASESGKG
jgi:diguanylate cyclase (GGDEF)-like protein